jgi:hypothetical protein
MSSTVVLKESIPTEYHDGNVLTTVISNGRGRSEFACTLLGKHYVDLKSKGLMERGNENNGKNIDFLHVSYVPHEN